LEIVGSWANISDRKQTEQALGERMGVMKDLQTLVAAGPRRQPTWCATTTVPTGTSSRLG